MYLNRSLISKLICGIFKSLTYNWLPFYSLPPSKDTHSAHRGNYIRLLENEKNQQTSTSPSSHHINQISYYDRVARLMCSRINKEILTARLNSLSKAIQ